MKTWQSVIVFMLIFAVVFLWRRNTAHAPTHQPPPGFPQPTEEEKATLPGNDPVITLARGALVVEGDVVDPIQEIRLARVHKPEEKIAFEAEVKSAAKYIGFFHVVPGEHYFVEVKTKFRTIVRDIAQPEKVEPLEIRRIPIHVKATNAGKPNVVFSPDGTLVAISTDSGELKLVEVFNGKERISKRVGKDTQALAFSGDGSRLVTLQCGVKTVVYCYETQMGAEVWRKELDPDVDWNRIAAEFLKSWGDLIKEFHRYHGNVFVFGEEIWVVYDLEHGWRAAQLEVKNGARGPQGIFTSDAHCPIGTSIMVSGHLFVSYSAGATPIFAAPLPVGGLISIDAVKTAESSKFEVLSDMRYHLRPSILGISPANDGKSILVYLSESIRSLSFGNDGKLMENWRREDLFAVPPNNSTTYYGPLSICGLGTKACVVGGRTLISAASPPDNSENCPVCIIDLADGHKITNLSVEDLPRYCTSSSDGRWLAVGASKNLSSATAKWKLTLFDSSSDASTSPRKLYTYSTKNLGATFSPDGRLLAVDTDSETASDPKSDEKTLDVVIIH